MKISYKRCTIVLEVVWDVVTDIQDMRYFQVLQYRLILSLDMISQVEPPLKDLAWVSIWNKTTDILIEIKFTF